MEYHALPYMHRDSGDNAPAGLGDHVNGHAGDAGRQRLKDGPQNSAAEGAQVVTVNEALTGECFLHGALNNS